MLQDPRSGRNARKTKTRRADVPWDVAGDGDLLFEMTAMMMLDPAAPGCPVHQIKCADQFRALFDPRRPMTELLEQTPREGLTILTGPHGRPLSYRQAAHAVMQVRRQIGAEAYDLHGLRHAAAHELAELGCSDELIQAVTGHASRAMVAHYAGAARQRARAKEAQSRRK